MLLLVLTAPATSRVTPGVAVPTPTFPAPSMTNGVVSLATSLTRKARLPVPVALCWMVREVLALLVPELVRVRRLPVLAALEPERGMSARLPVKAVALDAMEKALPEVRESAV